jgi:hypothetical protein
MLEQGVLLKARKSCGGSIYNESDTHHTVRSARAGRTIGVSMLSATR